MATPSMMNSRVIGVGLQKKICIYNNYMSRFILGFFLAIAMLNPKTTVHIVAKVVNTCNDIVSRFSYDTKEKQK
jgi:hypothetical protein